MLRLALLSCPSLLFAAFAFAQDPVPAPTPVPAPASAPRGAVAKEKAAAPVYDEKADARADVAAAVARAKKADKRVLIQWGANWCGWCKLLAGTMQKDKDVATELRNEYEVVKVDVGQFNKNVELAKELGAELKVVVKGIPFLTVLDADGKPLVQQTSDTFEINEGSKHEHDPKKLLEFLTQQQVKALVAKDVRAAGLARARSEHKLVFLHFGAPSCGWCHKLEDWMARPEIAALLGKVFVDVKIDTDRMTGGKEAYEAELKAADVQQDGIPWIVFLDGAGKVCATSNLANGKNTGFPSEIFEVEHFAKMLATAKVNLSDAEVKTLTDSLHAIREASKKAQPAGGH